MIDLGRYTAYKQHLDDTVRMFMKDPARPDYSFYICGIWGLRKAWVISESHTPDHSTCQYIILDERQCFYRETMRNHIRLGVLRRPYHIYRLDPDEVHQIAYDLQVRLRLMPSECA